MLALNVPSVFAADTYFKCVSPTGKGSDILIGSEEEGAQFKLKLSGNSFVTDVVVYNGVVKGTFVKVTKKGDYQFSSQGLAEFADQSGAAYTFVSKEIMSGKNGKLVFSVIQYGDSEGSWWINQNFTCSIAKPFKI